MAAFCKSIPSPARGSSSRVLHQVTMAKTRNVYAKDNYRSHRRFSKRLTGGVTGVHGSKVIGATETGASMDFISFQFSPAGF